MPNAVGGNGKWGSFPSPLLTSGITAAHDYLPLALESLPLAFVDISVQAKIAPILPYGRLRDLGTSGNGGLDAYESPGQGAATRGSPTARCRGRTRTQR